MALTWNNLNDELVDLGMQANAIRVPTNADISGNKLMIDLSAITNDAHNLSSPLVLEFLSKIIDLALAAQTTYNQNNPTPLTSINNPFLSTAQTDGNGSLFITKTQNVTVRLNIDPNTVLGVN